MRLALAARQLVRRIRARHAAPRSQAADSSPPRASHRTLRAARGRRRRRRRLLAAEGLEPRRLLAATDLDPTFGSSGLVVGWPDSWIDEMVLQEDGKIVAIGTTAYSHGNEKWVTRFLPDGSPDATFNGTGRVFIDAGALKILPDGDILVLGNVAGELALARFDPDGQLDSAFGTNDGLAFVNGIYAKNMELQGEQILLAGSQLVFDGPTGKDIVVTRLNSDGSTDTTFGSGGYVQTDTLLDNGLDLYSAWDTLYDIITLPDGKFITFSWSARSPFPYDYLVLTRYNANGSLDDGSPSDTTPNDSFSPNGQVMIPVGDYSSFEYMHAAIQPVAQRLLVAIDFRTRTDLTVIAFDMDGNVDTTFGENGRSTVFGGINYQTPSSFAVDSDGRITLVATSNDWRFTAARLNADGTFDTTFGNAGIFSRSLESPTAWEDLDSVVVQPDGRIIAGGHLGDDADESWNLGMLRLRGSYVPVADDVTFTIDEDTVLSDTLDVDNPFGDVFELVSPPSQGQLELAADGSFTYTPLTGYSDSFSYRLRGDVELSNEGTVTLTVNNVAPNVSLAGPDQGVNAQPLTYTFSATDAAADSADGFRYEIDWGDGSPPTTIDPTPNNTSLTLTHVYASPGTYTLRYFAVDRDGGSSDAIELPVAIASILQQGDDLLVGGTLAGDAFSFTREAAAVRVERNGTLLATYAGSGQIRVYGGEGTESFSVGGAPPGGLWIDGQEDGDTYTVFLGNLDGLVQVTDSGAAGADALLVYGTIDSDRITAQEGLIARGEPVLESVSHAGVESVAIDAGPSDDVLKAEPALALTLSGGSGADTLSVTDTSPGGELHFTLSNALLTSTAGGSLALANIERAVLAGGAGSNQLDATAFTGRATLLGGAGHDTLLGGQGADLLFGGGGQDAILAGGGADRIQELTGVSFTARAAFFDPSVRNSAATVNSANGPRAQTFTAAETGALAAVELLLSGSELERGDLLIDIRPTVNGVPAASADAALATVTLPAAAIPTTSAAEYVRVDFSELGVAVAAGQVLAITLRPADTTAYARWEGQDDTDPYPAGSAYEQPAFDGSPWTQLATQDLAFRTYVTTVSTAPAATWVHTYTVDQSGDVGTGSLREAITAANADATADLVVIDFQLMASDLRFVDVDSHLAGGDIAADAFVLSPVAELPAVDNPAVPLVINGLSQTAYLGDTNAFGPEIALDGGGRSFSGLTVSSDGNVIHSLNVRNFGGGGITLTAGTAANRIQGNYIGTDATGTAAHGNAVGVLLQSASDNWVGGTRVGEGNLISANSGSGIEIDATSARNTVQGNRIGSNAAGAAALPNTTGVLLVGPYNLIGGTGPDAGNLISGNATDGILVTSSTATDNRVQGNRVGTTAVGAASLGNTTGIRLSGGSTRSMIGGAVATAGNVLSGNETGLVIDAAHANRVQGNAIGTSASGSVAVANRVRGVALTGGASQNVLGTDGDGAHDLAEANVISGNSGPAVEMTGSATSDNVIAGNFIGAARPGATALGNGGPGITVLDASHNRIGTNGDGLSDAAEGNTIANNLGAAIRVLGTATGITIRGNSIYGHVSPGIDLGDDGPTSNDAGDADLGPNSLQNFPILTGALAGATTLVAGQIESSASTAFVLDFYASPSTTAAPVAGRKYLGATTVTTDANGIALFNASFASTTVEGDLITVTATDPAGNTSEFSPAEFAPANQPPAIEPRNMVMTIIPPEESGYASYGIPTNAIAEYDVINLSGLFENLDPDDVHVVEIHWGDGTVELLDTIPAGQRGFAAQHRYADDTPTGTAFDVYTIEVIVTDDEGASGYASTELTVFNVGPTLPDGLLLDAIAYDEGGAVSLSATFLDPGLADRHRIMIDWGDGSPPETIEPPVGGRDFSAAHVYVDDNGTLDYRITVRVQDDDGGEVVETIAVPVRNVAPQVTIARPTGTLFEGNAVVLDASVVDPGANDTFSYEWVAFQNGVAIANSTGAQLTLSPTDEATLSVRLRVTDDEGGVGEDFITLAIENRPPAFVGSVQLRDAQGNPVTEGTAEGDTITLSGAFADPGLFDAHVLTVDWGDGSPVETLDFDAGAFVFENFQHIYGDDNPSGTSADWYTITATITDGDGGSSTTTTTVQVVNVAPLLRISDNGSDPTTIRLVGAVEDPGSDTFTYQWTAEPASLLPPGTATDQAAISFPKPSSGVATVTLRVFDDDGGISSVTSLFISGTAVADQIVIDPSATTPGDITVSITSDGVTSSSDYTPTDQLIGVLGDGADTWILNVAIDSEVNGGEGSDTIIGSGGNDSINGGPGADILVSGEGDDTLVGAEGDDMLEGGAGNDLYQLVPGSDKTIVELDEGGIDTIDYALVTRATGDNIGITHDLTIVGIAQVVDGNGNTVTVFGSFENLIGTQFNDTLSGNAYSNLLDGGDGDDVLASGGGSDTIFGGAGADSISGALGIMDSTTIDGGLGNDSIFGGAGSDSLMGGLDDDTLISGGGYDTILGGDGNDSIIGSDLGTTIDGGLGNDTIFGGAGSESIFGSLGDDTILSGGGLDSIFGGAGSDSISGSIGRTTIDGGLGNDTIVGGSGGELILGGDDSDSIIGGGGTDTIFGGDGDDYIAGNLEAATIDGGAGNDAIFGGAGSESLMGGLGNDTIQSGGGLDSIIGDAGDDSIVAGIGTTTVDGGLGNDTIFGGAGSDVLLGGPDDDVIISAAVDDVSGADTIFGGAGNDSIQASLGPVTIDGGLGRDTIFGGAGDDSLVGGADDDVILSLAVNGVSGNDTIFGGAGNDSIQASLGPATIDGGLGNDSIFGGAGSDSLLGGLGDDVIVSAPWDGLTGTDTIFGGAGNDSLQASLGPAIIDGGLGNDSIFGGAGADSLTGGPGDDPSQPDHDTIIGGGGADTIVGGAGDDSLVGGVDAVTIDGGLGNDTIFGGAGADSLTGGIGNDSITGTGGSDTVLGGDGNDTLIGGRDPATIDGGLGQDSIFGGAGADSLIGGPGLDSSQADDDTIVGGGGADTIIGGAGADHITSGQESVTVDGGLGNDTIFGGAGADSLVGDFGNDIIAGQSGGDTILGGPGNDTLIGGPDGSTIDGGLGNDTIFGGAGADSVYGGMGDDSIRNLGGPDSIYGGAGNDSISGAIIGSEISGGISTDSIYGGGGADPGNDWVTYEALGHVTVTGTIQLSELLALGVGSVKLMEIDNVRISGGTEDNRFDTSGYAGNVALLGGAGNDTLIAGPGNDTLSGGSGHDVLDGGAGADTYVFGSDADGDDLILESDDDDGDTLDFAEFTSAVEFDLGATSPQGLSTNFSITLASEMGIENFVGTQFSDIVDGNARNNKLMGLGGNDLLAGFAGDDLLVAGSGVTVYLDFDSATGEVDHVYSLEERDAIEQRIRQDFAQFDVVISQIVPADGPFITVLFNEPPLIQGRPQPGGASSRIGWRRIGLGGTVIVDVNGFFGNAPNKLAPTLENFVALSSTIASHELAHIMGARHHDSFGAPGNGIFWGTSADQFLPRYPGPQLADESPWHLSASPASVGSTLIDALQNPFLGEREALKLAFGETGQSVLEEGSQKTVYSTPNGRAFLVQPLGELPVLSVPNTVERGSNVGAGETLSARALNVIGTIELGPDQRSENDYYSFTGQPGSIITVELMSFTLRDRIANPIDSILRVYDFTTGEKLPYFGDLLGALSDDNFEPTDSLLLDLELPADSSGIYIVEVDTFSFNSPEVTFYLPDIDPVAFCNANPQYVGCTDTDIGAYELLIYSFENTVLAPPPGDTIIGGEGADTLVGTSGNETYFVDQSDRLSDPAGVQNITGNNPPVLNPLASPFTGVEGSSVQLQSDGSTRLSAVTAFDPDGTTALRFRLDPVAGSLFPHGAVLDAVSGVFSWTPSENGHYRARVVVVDELGTTDSQIIDLLIENAAPTVDIIAPGGIFYESQTFVAAGSFADPGTDTWTATVDYGDGLGPQLLAFDRSSNAFPLRHRYLDSGNYTLAVTVTDDDGGTHTSTLEVAISNVAPTATLARAESLLEGEPATIALHSPTDVAGADVAAGFLYSFDVNGDGIFDVVQSTANALTIPADQLDGPSVLAVTARVEDKDGGWTDYLAEIEVLNVPPQATFAASGPVLEGSNATVSFTAAVDPSRSDSLAGFSYSYDFDNDGQFELANITADWAIVPGSYLTGSGSAVVRGRIMDHSGDYTDYTAAITIENVPPQLDAGPDEHIVGGQLIRTLTFQDPGIDTWTATVHYGDSGDAYSVVVDPLSRSFELLHTYAEEGQYTVSVTVDDGDGGETSDTFLVEVFFNRPPMITLDAAALAVDEGQQAINTGRFADDDVGDVVTLSASLGTVVAHPDGTWTWTYDALDGPAEIAGVVITATDKYGASATVKQTITVANVAPVIDTLVSDSSTLATRSDDLSVTIDGAFGDAGPLDTHTVLVDWGDGSPAEQVPVDQTADRFAGAHSYPSGGVYTITVTVIDKDGGRSAAQQTTAIVEGVGLVGGVLYVVGTDDKDDISIKLAGGSTGAPLDVDAKLSKGSGGQRHRLVYEMAEVQRIVILLAGGDDKAVIEKDVVINAWMYGGDGEDRLQGGGGNDFVFGEAGDDDLSGGPGSDVLVGGDGDDKLRGGPDGNSESEFNGRDILIGGRGADDLTADQGDDLLIGGFTMYDDGADLLEVLSREWQSSRDYATRVQNLRGSAGDVLSGTGLRLSRSGAQRTVFDDGVRDRLNGNSGREWFFAAIGTDKNVADSIAGKKDDESMDVV